MIFNFETNEPNGLVLIDEFFSEFNEELLYSFDIYLDVKGETELIYDFDEEWNVYNGARQAISHYSCNDCVDKQIEHKIVNITGKAKENSGKITRKKKG